MVEFEMGRLVDGETNGGHAVDGFPAKPVDAGVVYQLVRVEDDGRLVPATDDEVMEVKHLLEDDKKEVPLGEPTIHVHGLTHESGLSEKCDLEYSKGQLQSDNPADDLPTLIHRLEDEGSMPSCVSVSDSPKTKTVDGQLLDHCNQNYVGVACNLQENAYPLNLNGGHDTQLVNEEVCAIPVDDKVASDSSVSKTCSWSMPDFSLLEGEICLDDLSIVELQKAFQATFGRQTAVKDKVWLKRRIAMGLTNSCDIPNTSFTIKENKIVQKNVVQEMPDREQISNTDQSSGLAYIGCRGSPNSPPKEVEDQELPYCKRLRNAEDDMLHAEACVAKRVRKPTKRYIEELSEVEEREGTGEVLFLVRNSGRSRSPKSCLQSVHDNELHGRTCLTLQDSLGGFGTQIPRVCRARRGRPRENFMTLMNFVGTERQRGDSEILNNDKGMLLEQGMKDACDGSSDHNDELPPTLKTSPKRKHHRAWTLCEVLKLVDGVAKYGAGKWSEIKRVAFAPHTYRSSVDLKDKWRNLLRASLSLGPADKEVKISRKPSAIPIPIPILLRVRELAEMPSQSGIEFRPSKFAAHEVTIEPKEGSGFL